MIPVVKITNIIFIVFAIFVFVISFHATRLTRPQTNWWQCHLSTGLKQGVLGFNYKWLSLIQRCYQRRLIVLYWYCLQFTHHVCWTLIFSCVQLVIILLFVVQLQSVKNWNTPMIFDLKNGNITLIVQTDKWVIVIAFI